MTDLARAERARAAMDEFIGPAFDVYEADIVRRLTEIAAEAPNEATKISKLAMAVKVLRNVRRQVEAIADEGKIIEADVKRARQIEKINPYQRSILGL